MFFWVVVAGSGAGLALSVVQVEVSAFRAGNALVLEEGSGVRANLEARLGELVLVVHEGLVGGFGNPLSVV